MSDRLRIAMISIHSCPLGQLGGRDTGGMNVYIRELACALGAMGHQVDVYTRAHDIRDDQVYELGPGARLIHIQAGGVEQMGKIAQYRHIGSFACGVEDFRSRNGLTYDIIHSHYWLSGKVGQWLSDAWNVPNMVMFHTLGAVKNELGIGEEEPPLRIDTETEIIAGCQHIITATQQEKGDLIRLYGAPAAKVFVVPAGVNTNLFSPVGKSEARRLLGLPPSDRIILFVGRLEALKGLDRLLEAIAIEGRARLIVVGGDEHSEREQARLLLLARQLGIDERVSFVGMVKQDKLPFFYSAADFCAVPSYYESFGLVTLEALACGTPVVSTRVGVSRLIIREGVNGYTVTENEPRLLASRIAQVLDGNVASPEVIRESVRHLAWDNIAWLIEQEYRSLVGEPVLVE